MTRMLVRLAFIAAVALLGVAGGGFARASLTTLDQLAGAQLVPSAEPRLLGPINELGRNGWQCFPEQAAAAKTVHDAELPTTDGR